MIIRDLDEAKNTERRVDPKGWISIRLLLKDDNMGLSFHMTTIYDGPCQRELCVREVYA
jgi:L-ectoine synthase